jgi:hypothetical protein
MKFLSLKRWVLAAVVAFFVVGLCNLSAQEAATALSGVQQSAAKSALCSAIASKFPNPAAAGPSALSDPGVLSTATGALACQFGVDGRGRWIQSSWAPRLPPCGTPARMSSSFLGS